MKLGILFVFLVVTQNTYLSGEELEIHDVNVLDQSSENNDVQQVPPNVSYSDDTNQNSDIHLKTQDEVFIFVDYSSSETGDSSDVSQNSAGNKKINSDRKSNSPDKSQINNRSRINSTNIDTVENMDTTERNKMHNSTKTKKQSRGQRKRENTTKYHDIRQDKSERKQSVKNETNTAFNDRDNSFSKGKNEERQIKIQI